jgi:hypothetical protein
MTATGLLDAAVCCGFFAGGLGLGPVGASAGLLTIVGPAGALTTDGELGTPYEGAFPTA